MVLPWILPVFASLTAAINVLASTSDRGSAYYSMIPFSWTNLTTLNSATIISTDATQSAPVLPANPTTPTNIPVEVSDSGSNPCRSSSIPPTDPSYMPLTTPTTASEPSSPPSSSSSVAPAYTSVMPSLSTPPSGSSQVLPHTTPSDLNPSPSSIASALPSVMPSNLGASSSDSSSAFPSAMTSLSAPSPATSSVLPSAMPSNLSASPPSISSVLPSTAPSDLSTHASGASSGFPSAQPSDLSTPPSGSASVLPSGMPSYLSTTLSIISSILPSALPSDISAPSGTSSVLPSTVPSNSSASPSSISLSLSPATPSDLSTIISGISLILPSAVSSDVDTTSSSISSVLPSTPSNLSASSFGSPSIFPSAVPSNLSTPSFGISPTLPAVPSNLNPTPSGSSSVSPPSPGLVAPSSNSLDTVGPSLAGVSSLSSSGSFTAITSTITSIPPGLTVMTLPGTSYTANDWITTTDGSHQTTLLPLIVVGGGHGVVFWGFPRLPNIEFALPGLPKWHLPCIKILFITIGDCKSPPVTDESNTDNPPVSSPTDSVPSSTSTSSGSESSSSCSTTESVPSCVQTCSTVIQTGDVTVTSCASPTCTSIQACSATATTSTVFGTPTPIDACFYGVEASPRLSSPVVGATSCPLAKRNLPVPQGNINTFVNDEIDFAIASGNILQIREPSQDDINRGGFAQFNGARSSSKRIQFLDNTLAAGNVALTGCTTVYIFSKRGMWGAHFWDIPAFEQATELGVVDGRLQPIATLPSQLDNFNKAVTDFIADGDGPENPGIYQDLSNDGLFPQNSVGSGTIGVFIFTPKAVSTSLDNDLRFPVQVGRIKDRLVELLRIQPGSGIPIYTVSYKALKGSPEYRFGTFLIQYDPQQVSAVTGQTTAIVRVYAEGVAFPDMTWDPLPNQIPRKRSIEERNTSDCANSKQSPPQSTFLTSTIPATVIASSAVASSNVSPTCKDPNLCFMGSPGANPTTTTSSSAASSSVSSTYKGPNLCFMGSPGANPTTKTSSSAASSSVSPTCKDPNLCFMGSPGANTITTTSSAAACKDPNLCFMGTPGANPTTSTS